LEAQYRNIAVSASMTETSDVQATLPPFVISIKIARPSC